MNNLLVHIRNHLAHEQYLHKDLLTQKGSLFVSTARAVIAELKAPIDPVTGVPLKGWTIQSDPSDPKGVKWSAPADAKVGIPFTQNLMIPDPGDGSTVTAGMIWYMVSSIGYIVDTYRIVGAPSGSVLFTCTGGLVLAASSSSQTDTGNKVANKVVNAGTVTTITLTSVSSYKGVTLSLNCRYR